MPARAPVTRPSFRTLSSLMAMAVASTAAHAQSVPSEPPPPAPAPAPSPAAAPAAPQLEKVEIIQQRSNDQQERRQSTAAKIVIGREEIERFGDSTVGEVLKRLPGITLQGPPGRGGAIRMRGLGSGYTQILIDGERVPPGFSIDTLTPEQIERIEILRAPTAETGARAIAGTINIVTREGFKKRLNDLRMGFALDNGHLQPGLSWTRNDSVDDFIYNLSLSAFRSDKESESSTVRVTEDVGGTTVQRETSESRETRAGVHSTGRLQWRGEKGSSLVLMPLFLYTQHDTAGTTLLTQDVGTPPYDRNVITTTGHYANARLNAQWNQMLESIGRLELRGGIGQGRWSGRTQRSATSFDDINSSRGTTATLSSKLVTLATNDHSIVTGVEFEHHRGEEVHSEVSEGDQFSAITQRSAVYAQDEWNATPNWAMHAGLRWEGIRTRSRASLAGTALDDSSNSTSVWTPLLHTMWKPNPGSSDQVRLSLTRSYKAPTVQNLIGRPRTSDANSATRPDRAGNPDLKPELATGLDLAVERYLPAGGVLSANFFHREISDYMRSVTSLEGGRYVSRIQNVGKARTQGIELEAKFRLSDAFADAPPVELRINGSVFRSRVQDVPGPNNRLDQQPGGTLNLGADHRFRGTPFSVGANVNWQPGYTTRLSETQWVTQESKRVVDAFVLYTIRPGMQVRVSGSNLAASDYLTGSRYDDGAVREASDTQTSSYISWQVRLEMKL
jgi:outer membrane receptor for ferrienterochelin and colicins